MPGDYTEIAPQQKRTGQRDILSKNVVSRTLGTGAISESNFDPNTVTPNNTANTIVQRDVNGNFAANIITGKTTGNENPLGFSAPLSRSVNTISIPAATSSVDGYLAHSDWTTFNNKLGSSGGTINGNLILGTAGNEFKIKEGTNAAIGTAVLAGGGTPDVVVSNTLITANSRIFLTIQAPGGTVGAPFIKSRSAGTSFTISSTSTSDTSTVSYLIVEPA